jgi:hypothetical protein
MKIYLIADGLLFLIPLFTNVALRPAMRLVATGRKLNPWLKLAVVTKRTNLYILLYWLRLNSLALLILFIICLGHFLTSFWK